jgi:hypothetical protein
MGVDGHGTVDGDGVKSHRIGTRRLRRVRAVAGGAGASPAVHLSKEWSEHEPRVAIVRGSETVNDTGPRSTPHSRRPPPTGFSDSAMWRLRLIYIWTYTRHEYVYVFRYPKRHPIILTHNRARIHARVAVLCRRLTLLVAVRARTSRLPTSGCRTFWRW